MRKKILLVRFSSIGDIVLTSPVIRAIKEENQDVEIHFITKKNFLPVVENNPYLDKIYCIEKEIDEVISSLKKEKYDFILDLHNNLRSRRLTISLGVKSLRFEKLNLQKWLSVHFKINKLPDIHIVDRYLKTTELFVKSYKNKGLDYFLKAEEEEKALEIKQQLGGNYHVLVIGGTHFTKQIPISILQTIAKNSELPIVLLGGRNDVQKASELTMENVLDCCGKLSINQSAAVIKHAQKIVTSDTGMMHIAAAFRKPILSVWGNTIPEFGMYPYFQKEYKINNTIFEVKNLGCRPCSKIGFKSCPKKHFNCMMLQDVDKIVKNLNE